MDRRSLLKYTAYLTGYAVAAPFASAILSGCQAEPSPEGQAYNPLALTAAEFAALTAMADAMLPATDTPSASHVGVPEFVDLQLAKYALPEDKDRIHGGLKDWLSSINEAEGKNYQDFSAEKQLALLNKLNKESLSPTEATQSQEESEGKKGKVQPWWISLKGMLIGSYFSSEEIGLNVLAYNPVPGPYQGCISLEEATGGTSWSLHR